MKVSTTRTNKTFVKLEANRDRLARTALLAGQRLHFVGVGGCGMSGLALLAKRTGAMCTGSDLVHTEVIQTLQQAGIDVSLSQSTQTLPSTCDAVVISAAIAPNHPEVQEAKRRGLQVIKYAQMLGHVMVGRTGVAIAGTHGKSTTASMLGHVLLQCGLDPSFIIGANCRQIGGGARSSKNSNDLLIAEACEYDRSFHHLCPKHAVILNVEEDHLDVYGSIEAIVEAFGIFAKRVSANGMLLINHEMTHRLAITAGLDSQVETIGFAPQAHWRVAFVEDPEAAIHTIRTKVHPPHPIHAHVNANNRSWVCIFRGDVLVAYWPAAMPGEHMAYNAAAAAVMANRLGAAWEDISMAMASFEGLDRRMQLVGHRKIHDSSNHDGRITVVDDYGHHPTEIHTTLRALRRHYKPNRLICVFQPHQHSRTRFLMKQFAASFTHADIVIVPHIYFVRDSQLERHAVSARDLVDQLRQHGKQAMHVYPFDAIVEQLHITARTGDLVVTMGAGDVWQVAKAYLQPSSV